MPSRVTAVHNAATGDNMGATNTGDIYTLQSATTASPRVDDISMPGMQIPSFNGRLHENLCSQAL